METQQTVEKGQRRRLKNGRIYLVGDFWDRDGSRVITFEDDGSQTAMSTSGLQMGTLVLPDIDWRNVAEGQAGEARVCLKCGGEKPGQVFTCEPCGKLEGTAKMALEWQQMMTAKRMAEVAGAKARHARTEARNEALQVMHEALGHCRRCGEMPTVPPGMNMAVRNQMGWCWACHLRSEVRVEALTNDPERAEQNIMFPTKGPLKLEPYDNRVAGIGAFGRIWRMR